jgi:glycosyltransferase involved in cell wall biosynthesis
VRICIIGSAHPCHNPRLIREADSLTEAGHRVRVVAPCFTPELAQKDRRLTAKRKWRLETVDFRPIGMKGRFQSLLFRGRRRLAQDLFRWAPGVRIAAYGFTMAFPELVALACREPADWYIAHAQPALPVAAAAARRWKVRLGFDCEDFLAEGDNDPADMVRMIEKAYLPFCDYVSVPSEHIGKQLEKDYRVPNPLVLYNTFPVCLANGLIPPRQRRSRTILRLHWFGQTIGPDRGIEEAIEAMGLIGQGVELHLRGQLNDSYRSTVEFLASRHAPSSKVVFHPQVDHDELIGTLDQFDVGLALEKENRINASKTVSNKLFSYLLAGLAVAATDTPGQREILSKIPSAGFLYPEGNPKILAEGLQQWIANSHALREAQQAAWERTRREFCWDREKEKLLSTLRTISGVETERTTGMETR